MCIRWFFNIVEQNARCDNKNNGILDTMMNQTQLKKNFKVELSVSLWVSNNH
jgi:hypothetical protein